MDHDGELRELSWQWNYWMICAAMAMSFLGTFTTTQVMIQARASSTFVNVLSWITIASVAFGFCSSWSLHFVAMLACELDLPIDLDIGLTVLTAILAVTFTFAGLGLDLLLKSYKLMGHSPFDSSMQGSDIDPGEGRKVTDGAHLPLLGALMEADHTYPYRDPDSLHHAQSALTSDTGGQAMFANGHEPEALHESASSPLLVEAISAHSRHNDIEEIHVVGRPSEEQLTPARRMSYNSDEIGQFMDSTYQPIVHDNNALVATYRGLYNGFNRKHVWRGLVWSLSLWCMHYGGLLAMRIPNGYITFKPFYVVLAEIISWVVCIVGSIFMEHIEPFLSQQVLFSGVATLGIAAMHFTGMRSATFYSHLPPSNVIGYPPQLPIAIVAIAITTCMLANGLLAHVATMSRNKLAEMMFTRRKLWSTIAQKEAAEANAAARSTFIASASHEIRTPLHQLQGYTDLLSQNELCDDSRELLQSIQLATRTLSLSILSRLFILHFLTFIVTNNVLDWSKLESNTDAMCRSVPLDIRSVCESILVLLPHHRLDDAEVNIMLAIAPSVPETLLLDETYINRILMNLLSNSLKFTRSGYVILSFEVQAHSLVVKVSDSGSGIPSSFLPRLFDSFTQAQTRGSQRGTGLGLNIVKKLLSKMDGTIQVKSQYGADPSGTTFTIRLPLEACRPQHCLPGIGVDIPTVVLLHYIEGRTLEGLESSWELSGYRVAIARSHLELPNMVFKYIWVEADSLEENPESLRYLVEHDEWIVLVPYVQQAILKRLCGLLSAPHLVPISRPLVWHTFEEKVANAKQALLRHKSLPKLKPVIIAPSAGSDNDESNLYSIKPRPSEAISVLLVEDNPINLKLGMRMLTTLGYSVLVARDGEEGLQQILKHDATIDVILMDQSMPMKDGVTATREIRELEGAGTLSKRHTIIACTAVVDTDSRALFREAGADEFLAKPLSLTILDQTLLAILRNQ